MSLFEQILNTNLINFIIVLSTLVLIYKKAHLDEVIQKLADDIRLSVETSSQNAKSALDEYREVKKSTKDTPKLQEEIIENAKNSAFLLEEKDKLKTQIQKEEIEANIEKAFHNQNEKAKKVTLQDVYLACVDLAQAEVEKNLNKDTHKALIDNSIDELDKIEVSLF